MKTQRGDENLGCHPYFDIRHNLDGKSVSSMHWSHFTPKKIPWYSFMLDTEWIPSLITYDCILLKLYVHYLL